MKKILFTLISFSIVTATIAQDAADKSFQAGLVIGTGMNFQKMETKRIATDGIGRDLTIGANVIFNFSETIGFNTGVEFDFETLNYKTTNYEGKSIYYHFNDTEMVQAKDATTSNKIFELESRQHKLVYLTIPTVAVFRTNFIGYMRYFGKFGLRNSFALSNKITDEGFIYADNNITNTDISNRISATNSNMIAKNEVFFFKSAVGASIGAEWNFTGSTCLVGEIGYYYGFTALHSNLNEDKGKNYLYATDVNNGLGNDVQFNNAAKQQQLQLKISILF